MTPAVSEALVAARRAWPDVHLADDEFAAAIAARADGAAIDDAVVRLCSADLYLAEACARGEPAACAAFAELVRQTIARSLRPIVGAADIDDLQQIVCQRLLVPAAADPARIASYNGLSRLASWVRVMASRIAIDQLRRRRNDEPFEDTLAVDLLSHSNPELDAIRNRYRDRFKAAISSAIEALPVRDRTLLRFSLEQELTAEEIGQLYGVHRVTVARWLRGIRDQLCRSVVDRLGVDRAELDSILQVIRSQISISLARILGQDVANP